MSGSGVSVTLPCGYLVDGKLQTSAVIVPMTGKTRKMIARPQTRQNPASICDTILIECVQEIGTTRQMRKSVCDKLFIADRDALLLEIRKISMGPKVTSALSCTACKEKMELSIDLDRDIPILKLSDIPHEIEDNEIIVTVEDPDLEYSGKFRLPRGEDQHFIAPILRKNPVEAGYVLHARTVMDWNGEPKHALDPEWVDELPLTVLDDLDAKMSDLMPGPSFRVPVNCIYCENEMQMSLESSDFLFPLQKKTRT